MIAEILSVGTELLLGNTVNTDARDISESLSGLGINVYYHTVVGDNEERLRKAVEIASARSDLIITTGGLGPTFDDLTKQVLASTFGLDLYFDETEAERIRSYFAKRSSFVMTENNMRQAMLPCGCTVFRNDWGTAPGCAFRAKGKTVLMLPGPPRECNAMFKACAEPYLRALSDGEIVSHSLHVFGLGESSVEDKLLFLMNELTNPTLAPYAKEGEVMLRVTAKAVSREAAERMMEPVIEQVREVLGDIIYGIDVDSMEARALELLYEKNMTLALAEDCTGGLLAKRMTDFPGASRAMRGGFVAYSSEAKERILGIPKALLEEKGEVSREIAEQMAKKARELLSTSIGVGITGFASEADPGSKESGRVFIAMASETECYVVEKKLGFGRDRVRTAAANNALDMIRRYLTGLPVIP